MKIVDVQNRILSVEESFEREDLVRLIDLAWVDHGELDTDLAARAILAAGFHRS